MKAFSLFLMSLLVFPTIAQAQLAERHEQLQKQYQEDRTRGLILLNRRYIKNLQQELQSNVQSGNLDDAIRIKERIKNLNTEIAELEQKQNENPSEEKTADELLSGKIMEYSAWEADPNEKAYLRFVGKGEAYWLGIGNQSVTREYKPTGNPREVELWWPARPELNHIFITVAKDGKTAEVRRQDNGWTTTGTLTKDRGDIGPRQ